MKILIFVLLASILCLTATEVSVHPHIHEGSGGKQSVSSKKELCRTQCSSRLRICESNCRKLKMFKARMSCSNRKDLAMDFYWLAGFLCMPWVVLDAFNHAHVSSIMEDDATVSTALDIEQYVMDAASMNVEDHRQTISDALDVSDNMGGMKMLKKQSALVKLGSFLGDSLKAVHAAGAIAGFIFTFVMAQNDDITDLINKRFNEVNAKLDDLDEKLDEMQKSIKANVAFNVFLAQWIEWENSIENGQLKLREIRNSLGRTTDTIQRVKLAEDYVNYYENNNLNDNLMNLYKMAAHARTTTHRNLFDLFIAEHGCDISMLSGLMLIIKNDMTMGAQQRITYLTFKGGKDGVKEAFDDIQTKFYEIRTAFDSRIWQCRSDALEQAKDEARKMAKELKDSSREHIIQAIHKKLRMKYPQYTWAVTGAKVEPAPHSDFEIRGDSYFKIVDDSNINAPKTYYVVYGTTNMGLSCNNIRRANTLVVFKKCAQCGSVVADNNIISNDKCGKRPLIASLTLKEEEVVKYGNCKNCEWDSLMYYLKRELRCDSDECDACRLCSGIVQDRFVKPWDFIASVAKTRNRVCNTDRCNGNGQCRAIPYTRDFQCICDPFYEGETCEKRVEFDDTVHNMISELRQEFNLVNGVPTTVDVFYSIKDLKQNLEVVMQKVRTSFAHTNQIIQHSGIIQIAEDFTELYARLQKNEITFERFGETVEQYLYTVANYFQLENRLKKMILGQGILTTPGNDIYNTYKREYVSANGGACTQQYNNDVKRFLKNLAYLDQAVGEVLLLHQKWLIETKGTTTAKRDKFKDDARYIQTTYTGRQTLFHQYWQTHSCGQLSVNNSVLSCENELTFAEMSIPMLCDEERQAEPSSVTCSRQNGALQWTSQPVCKRVWSEYSDWSSCTKSCDGGVTFQNRTCLGTDDLGACERDQGGLGYKVKECNTQPCCSKQFGKYQCANGRCILKAQLCDGRNNCGDSEDENEENCPHVIRSGMTVALLNDYKKNYWLSCYCWSNKAHCLKIHGSCKLEGCPGSVMGGTDWTTCWSERFYLFGIGREEGVPIRNGDLVGLKYKDKESGNWLSCSHDYCAVQDCPGNNFQNTGCSGEKFRIFSPDRLGSCNNDARSECIGAPIENGDMVLLYYKRENKWVCQWDYEVMKHDCSGDRFTNTKDCNWEKWFIYSKEAM